MVKKMKKEIDELKSVYRNYVFILQYYEKLDDSEYRTIKYSRRLKRLKNRTLKDMDILYKFIKELGGIDG